MKTCTQIREFQIGKIIVVIARVARLSDPARVGVLAFPMQTGGEIQRSF